MHDVSIGKASQLDFILNGNKKFWNIEVQAALWKPVEDLRDIGKGRKLFEIMEKVGRLWIRQKEYLRN